MWVSKPNLPVQCVSELTHGNQRFTAHCSGLWINFQDIHQVHLIYYQNIYSYCMVVSCVSWCVYNIHYNEYQYGLETLYCTTVEEDMRL